MSTNQDIVNLLEKYHIKDDFLAEKYETLSAQKKALIKTAIAFQFSFHQTKWEEERYFSNKNSGFFYGIHKKPAPFLLCVLDQEFTSPATLLSILCPAVIAGVENIYIFLSPNTADSILASLELSGMENIYILENKSSTTERINLLSTCLNHLSNDFPYEKGRLIFFSQDTRENVFFNQLEKETPKIAIQNHMENHNPTLYAKKESHALINFAYTFPHIMDNNADITAHNEHDKHTNTQLKNEPLKANAYTKANDIFATLRNNASASFTAKDKPIADISFIPDLLGMQNYNDGMELCYIHPTIDIDFFINKKISAQMPHSDII